MVDEKQEKLWLAIREVDLVLHDLVRAAEDAGEEDLAQAARRLMIIAVSKIGVKGVNRG
jgi:hypothetical protein